MTKKEFYDLLLKFEKKECTAEEENLLFQFYNSFQNNNRMSSWNLSEKEEARIRLLKRINTVVHNSKKQQVRTFNWIKIASIAALYLGFGFIGFLYFNKSTTNNIPKDAITLQFEDGTIKVINENSGAIQVLNNEGQIVGKQEGRKLIYNKEGERNVLTYNTLKVPYGKTFELQLSDGTKVQLNSGSSLKYPVNFIEGKDRLVYIVGEAYFDVEKDLMHPFLVNINELNVKVIGTQFNVHAYPEDDVTEVVLVEGSVGLYKEEKESDKSITYLTPGFKASFSKNSKEITKTPVLTNIYTSWVEGELVFRDMEFDNILKKLERFYDIDITNDNNSLSGQKFQASFGKKPNIEEVFEELKMIYEIDYTINGKSITIK
ncbi:hypothetical protein APS56_15770 [Pseudalgibacter alginicilyticus]|uniref:Iron dicitrate transport regulator FecR n=1 Tax=Pseudalgibacter alginicilyticus TaxID=1736674 RepID=A0A0P0CPX2_9FLAO|nr:FecR domain-containing protein [Pseudalgibacter alginicilyticus]ALJ06503.1 hypothetical protein APS56_15770 [Pseudalgibacter alginicilyticus]